MGDELARQRRELPWVAVEKEYTLRDRRRNAHAGRAVRWPFAACHLPLHVRAGLHGWLSDELIHRR